MMVVGDKEISLSPPSVIMLLRYVWDFVNVLKHHIAMPDGFVNVKGRPSAPKLIDLA